MPKEAAQLVRVMNEYGASLPVWYLDEPEQIHAVLKMSTIQALEAWSRYFQENFDHEHGWPDQDKAKEQYKIGLELARQVRRELPETLRVEYWPWEHKKRKKRIN